MRDVYTPGVARACVAISEEPSLAGELTMIGRSVAICTNGTRVLGLGDVGPVASMPVMEGKAVFYHQFANVWRCHNGRHERRGELVEPSCA